MNDWVLPHPKEFFARFPLRHLFKDAGEVRAGEPTPLLTISRCTISGSI
jgi:hypothetical protein